MEAAQTGAPPLAHDWREHYLLPPDGLYLDTAANAPRLRCVQAAAQRVLDEHGAPWHARWAEWNDQVERVRTHAAALFGSDAGSVALVPSAGYGLTLAARNLPLAAGDAVLVLADTFPSNLLPWQHRCLETGARLLAVGRGVDATAAVLEALHHDPAVRIVSLPHAHWHDGQALDLDAIATAVHARGAALVLDLSQSLGAWPAAIARWRPAFAVSVGYKWLLGPLGLSYLWASPHWCEHGRPLEHNWIASEARETWVFPLDRPAEPRPGARRFDAGGILDPQRLAMAESGLAWLAAHGTRTIATRLGELTARLRLRLREHAPGIAMPAAHAPHLIGLRPPEDRFAHCVQALGDARIACTARHGRLRVAPHLHVDEADMDRLAAVLAAAL